VEEEKVVTTEGADGPEEVAVMDGETTSPIETTRGQEIGIIIDNFMV
jgi:hypothetical protein